MTDLGLSSNHEEEVKKYLKFARYNRNQQVRSVEGCFEDLKIARLHEDTFTVDEVSDMLDGLQAVVKSSIESELLNAAHTNVLLLVQLFTQAEKWHLKLQADISELENQKLLKEIADFEEQDSSGRKSKIQSANLIPQKTKLEPLNEGGSAALLQMEINRLKEENEVLKNKVTSLEKSTSSGLDEASKLRADLREAKSQQEAKYITAQETTTNDEINVLSKKISLLSSNLQEAESLYKQKYSSMEEELASTKHYTLALQHELETLREEFDKKFAETTQFKNMKKMLEGKNAQIKELRAVLKRYDPENDY
ncbi:leucine zipper transcription factor-like protein 1 isoform X2 [Hydra vulgaris]|uniref:Leucine zipper transcription factor-like protein 1 n=1 Tax=Hydra vulgaris TaxID=6087 RepID=A0ABM4CVE5_HYDVU